MLILSYLMRFIHGWKYDPDSRTKYEGRVIDSPETSLSALLLLRSAVPDRT